MSSRQWTADDVPDQRGRVAVVTGANSGIGYHVARVLAQRGATTVLACRDRQRARDAAARILAEAPGARVKTVHLDLASLASVRLAAQWLADEYPRIDVLVNNAGGIRPQQGRSVDGYELTLATNHLGPFAFTGLLLPRMTGVPGSRIVTVSSTGHRRGAMNFDDLQFEREYKFDHAYFQSKLANLLYTDELQERLAATGAQTIAVATHPGAARTAFGREMNPFIRVAMSPRLRALTWWFLQTAEMGALGALRAATDPAVRGGEFYGPPGRAQFTGYPVRITAAPQAYDIVGRQRLWAESERLTGVTYPLGATV
jgi:NAD(P)-dependent dehydrogenase (short-subunit alcohol dehydrogenase family)